MRTRNIAAVSVILALAIAGYIAFAANGISASSAAVDAAWEKAEAAHASRYGLMAEFSDTLSSVVSGEMTQYLDDLDAARERYAGADTPDAKAFAAGEIEAAYTSFLFALENDQAAKALPDVQRLVSEIAATEGSASEVRAEYNATVREYNRKAGKVPGYEPRAYFQSADGI